MKLGILQSFFIFTSGIQGIVLYRQLRASIFSSRFVPGKLQVLLTFILGYGIPICFVISLLINSYFDGNSHYIRYSENPDTFGDPNLCWIDIDSILWAFIGPLIVILVLNFIIIVMVLKTAMEATIRSRQAWSYKNNQFHISNIISQLRNASLKHNFLPNYRKNKQLQNVGMAVRNFILLATLLGLTWTFGFLPLITQRYV